MHLQLEMSDAQARKMAEKIGRNGFRMYGIGHFDVSFEDFAEILKLSFSSKKGSETKLDNLYKELYSNMR